MKSRKLAASTIFAAASIVVSQPQSLLIITGARVLDVAAGRYQPAAALVIQGDRIAAIHDRMPDSLPDNAERLDLAGATLVPGLGDMLARGAPAGALDVDYFYALALANGVTLARAIDVPLRWGVEQRDRVRAGDVLAPRLWTSGPAVGQRAGTETGTVALSLRTPLSMIHVADTISATRVVDMQARGGADWIRVHGSTTVGLFKALVSAAHSVNVRISGDAVATSMLQAAEMGVAAIDGLGSPAKTQAEYGQAFAARSDFPRNDPIAAADYIWEHATSNDMRTTRAALVRARVTLVPRLSSLFGRAFPDEAANDPGLDYVAESVRADMKAMAAAPAATRTRAQKALQAATGFVREFVRAGGRIATGSGSNEQGYPVAGFTVQSEMVQMVRFGLTPIEALRAATINCAEMVGAADSLGQIKVGYRADLFAVDGEPLKRVEDLARIRVVIRGGEVLDRPALLEEARRAARLTRSKTGALNDRAPARLIAQARRLHPSNGS